MVLNNHHQNAEGLYKSVSNFHGNCIRSCATRGGPTPPQEPETLSSGRLGKSELGSCADVAGLGFGLESST